MTPSPRSQRGLSITEMLVALSISALLLTAVTVALNASFYAYAAAAESASTQSSVRIVMQRVMHMIRNATVHDAYDPDQELTLQAPGLGPIHTAGIRMIDEDGKIVCVWWEENEDYDLQHLGDVWYGRGDTQAAAYDARQPLLERVRAQVDYENDEAPYVFSLSSRYSPDGLIVHRATLDLSVKPGADSTLSVESARGSAVDVRIISSTMPRRNLR